ncbi:hypothetical protein [Rubripirellula lacrimiformis]|uniref:hypothetical protein n=1 Tax=Rubripirellula lacrimiformis TaxID=1930273 RepID=UPI0011A0C0D8|nr:hypothetical protein [Rubripirellula lacrimiformis]
MHRQSSSDHSTAAAITTMRFHDVLSSLVSKSETALVAIGRREFAEPLAGEPVFDRHYQIW